MKTLVYLFMTYFFLHHNIYKKNYFNRAIGENMCRKAMDDDCVKDFCIQSIV